MEKIYDNRERLVGYIDILAKTMRSYFIGLNVLLLRFSFGNIIVYDDRATSVVLK